MKAIKSKLIIFGVLLAATAGAQTLVAGMQAPGLKVGRWLKGTPIKTLKPGNVYVVEFWATWCGPCKESIPMLTQLAKTYAGKVTVIGVSVFERDTADTEPFVRQMGDKMDYNVCIDDQPSPKAKTGAMAKAWMAAAGQDSIPTAFVVGRTCKIEYIGSPFDMEKGQVIQQVLAGSWDRVKFARQSQLAAKEFAKRLGFSNRYYKALKAKDWRAALEVAIEAQRGGMEDLARTWDLRVYILSNDEAKVHSCFDTASDRLTRVIAAYGDAAGPKNEDATLRSLDEAEGFLNKQATKAKLERLKVYLACNDIERFTSYARELIATDDPQLLNGVAWRIAGPDYGDSKKGIPSYDDITAHPAAFRSDILIAMANKAASRAIELTQSKSGPYLDTMAWVCYRLGKGTEAARVERVAAAMMDGESKAFYTFVAGWFLEAGK